MNITGSGSLNQVFAHPRFKRGAAFGIIIVLALIAFEIFNFSTTDYALRDLLGDLRFVGLRWATVLSIAFCGIDFAGIARLFTPEQGNGHEPTEVWYLFGAWLLAATMNAILTWWGVSIAIVNRQMQSTAVIEVGTLVKIVPIFVAVMVWVIRILIIGSLSYAGDRIFSQADRQPSIAPVARPVATAPASHAARPASMGVPAPAGLSSASHRPVSRPSTRPETSYGHQEPTYVSLSPRTSARPTQNRSSISPDPRR